MTGQIRAATIENMSATVNADTPAESATRPPHLTFPGILRSEWIKLRSLRSTFWSFGIVFVLQIAFGLLIAAAVTSSGSGAGSPASVGADLAVTAATLGTVSAQLVISIQAVLLMAGEFSTGMINSSFAAVPRRLPVLWAKTLVFTAVTLVASLAGVVGTFFITLPILRGADYQVDVASGELWLRLFGGGAYLAFIGVIAVGVGAVTRVPAGGIAVTLGALLVLPSVLPLLATTWAGDLISWLPGLAGQELFFWGASPVPSPFEPWQALIIMCGWSALALAAAAVTLTRRDA
jgi:ABC-2 type transport system permease protein